MRSSKVIGRPKNFFELLFVSLSLGNQLLCRLLLHFCNLLGQCLHHILHAAQYLVHVGRTTTIRRALHGLSHCRLLLLLDGLDLVLHDLKLLEDVGLRLEDAGLRLVDLICELLVTLLH